MADIVLINPRFEVSYWGLEYAMPFMDMKAILPVACLPLLAALTPTGHQVTLIDENVEAIDFARCARADIVGVTGMNVQRPRMHEILDELKARGIFTVVGGPWVTVAESDLADRADVIFIGEAEQTWPQFLAEWSEGRHQRRYEQAERTDMETVPAPRLDLLRMRKYAFGSVQFSRGCPFSCEFCDIIVTFGRRPRIKNATQVIAELDGLRAAGKEYAFIVDDNLIGNKKVIKPLLREVIAWQKAKQYPITFVTEASIDLGEDEELLELMVDANIMSVFVGIESPNDEALREIKKTQNLRHRTGTVLEKVHRIQEAGIEVWCGMIVGFDQDDQSVFAAQHRFVREARIAHVMVNLLTAIPRTPLYKRLQAEGRLDLDYSAGWERVWTNVRPLRIGREALRRGYVELLQELYTPAAYFDRLDALYLDLHLQPGSARARCLRHHPGRWLKLNARLLGEALAIFTLLMHGVAEAELRRIYRRRLWRIAWRRRNVFILHLYLVKCAMHYHAHRLVQDFSASLPAASAAVPPEPAAAPVAA